MSSQPRYPVYIISKSRWRHQQRLTSRALDAMGLNYRVVIEPTEYEQYAAEIDPARLLVLPFHDLGQGSIPARNWVWDHAVSEGHDKHWILDDNIRAFYFLNHNQKIRFCSGYPFTAIETLTDCYENIALAGMRSEGIVTRYGRHEPYALNRAIYSCILIDHQTPFRWRGRYNEDSDLSLRCLKSGWCTMLFHVFLMQKTATMRMAGGNTESLYQGDGRYQMAKSLQEQHPDCVRISYKWGRYQHHVNYKPFARNPLKLKPGAVVPALRPPKLTHDGNERSAERYKQIQEQINER